MKHIEIEAIFTAKVNEFITNGYTINATTMSGSQGEIAKVDVRKGDEIIRILLKHDTEWKDIGSREMVTMIVGRSTEDPRRFRPFETMCSTIWNERLDIIEQRKFYRIDNRADFFTESAEDYDMMQEKQFKRYRSRRANNSDKRELSEDAREIAKRYIKRTTSKARVSTDDIKVFRSTRNDHLVYIAEYRGHNYQIG